jgi:hypothetical protein
VHQRVAEEKAASARSITPGDEIWLGRGLECHSERPASDLLRGERRQSYPPPLVEWPTEPEPVPVPKPVLVGRQSAWQGSGGAGCHLVRARY